MEQEKRYKRIARLLLGAVVLTTVFLAYQMSQIGVDYDFDRFYAEDDPETGFF